MLRIYSLSFCLFKNLVSVYFCRVSSLGIEAPNAGSPLLAFQLLQMLAPQILDHTIPLMPSKRVCVRVSVWVCVLFCPAF